MTLLGARLARVEPGLVEIELPFREGLTQQHGYLHAVIVGTVADSAGEYVGFTLMPAGREVLTMEYKMNLLTPATGERALARGRVVRSGRTLTVCDLEVDAVEGKEKRTCARGLQTLTCVDGATARPRSR